MEDSERPAADRLRGQFGRDVGVNVLANLIATAIVYLVGVAVGLLPNKRMAVVVAVLLLACTLLIWAAAVGHRIDAWWFRPPTGIAAGFAFGAVLMALNAPNLLVATFLAAALVVALAVVGWTWARSRAAKAAESGTAGSAPQNPA